MHNKNFVIITGVHPYRASGRCVTDLKNILKNKGHNVIVITNSYLSKEFEDIISVESRFRYLYNKIYQKIKIGLLNHTGRYIDPNYYMFKLYKYKFKYDITKILNKIPFKPNAFIYLFPHDFLNEEALFELNKHTGAPIYRYMVDMAELTGGCHYTWDCEGYIKNCGNCPALYSNNPRDITYEILKYKKKFIDKFEIYPIAASEWQFQQLLKSSIYKNTKKFKLLLPIDDKIFFLQDKSIARKALGLPLDKKIILFGSVNILEKRKGLKELFAAINSLKDLMHSNKLIDIHLAIAGNTNNTVLNKLFFNYTTLGYLDYYKLALAYNAADVFVCPSLEDSGPTMINQSLMCGTPIVSFKMGVALDLIINFKTGYKAELGNIDDLAKGIFHFLSLSEQEIQILKFDCYMQAKNLTSYDAFYSNLLKILN
jgi:glycosyltransferase involved in cell wall biosynthesis